MMNFGQFVPYEGIKITTVVSVDDNDLSIIPIGKTNEKSLSEIRRFLNTKIKKLKTKTDQETNKKMNRLKSVPTAIVSLLCI